MVNERLCIHPFDLKGRINNVKNWKVPDSVKKDILDFCDACSIGQVHKGFKISDRRIMKYLSMLRLPMERICIELKALTIKDIEQFERELSTNKILSIKGKPYAEVSKSDIKKCLKIFLKWKLGDKSVKLVGWLDVRSPVKTPDYLSELEIEKLFKVCKNAKERFLIAVLFDSGARAEEFHNIRKEDVQLPSDSNNFVKITLKEEYSKTKGRVISLYWKHSIEAVRDFITLRLSEEIKSQEPVFNFAYASTRQLLLRLGKKALKKPIHYHLFRHSSATYYANKLNRQELCYRYGWKFSSDMPDIYISRAGMESKELDVQFQNTDIEVLRGDLEKMKLLVRMILEKQPIIEKLLKKFKISGTSL